MRIVQLTPEQQGMLARKARHGRPCTSCGLCCSVQLCDMATAAFKRARDNRQGPCPALVWTDGKSSCGLLTEPTKHSARGYAVSHETATKAAALLVDPGVGCDMGMAGDYDEVYHFWRDLNDRARLPMLRWAAAVWGFRIKRGI